MSLRLNSFVMNSRFPVHSFILYSLHLHFAFTLFSFHCSFSFFPAVFALSFSPSFLHPFPFCLHSFLALFLLSFLPSLALAPTSSSPLPSSLRFTLLVHSSSRAAVGLGAVWPPSAPPPARQAADGGNFPRPPPFPGPAWPTRQPTPPRCSPRRTPTRSARGG